jgi:hypothetical protein
MLWAYQNRRMLDFQEARINRMNLFLITINLIQKISQNFISPCSYVVQEAYPASWRSRNIAQDGLGNGVAQFPKIADQAGFAHGYGLFREHDLLLVNTDHFAVCNNQ